MERMLLMNRGPGNLLTLQFSGALEEEFRDDYFRQSLMQLRFAIVVGIAIYALFGIFDAWITPEIRVQAWIIRYAIVCPFGIILFLFTYSPHFKKYMQLALSLAILVAAVGIIAILAMAQSPGSYFEFAGLMFTIMYASVLVRLRFVYASLTIWTVAFLYAVTALWISDIPSPVFGGASLIFVVTNFVGMVSSYQLELTTRRYFLQTRTVRDLEEKKHQIETDKLQAAIDAATTTLRESELKFRTLARTTSAATFIHRGEKFLYVNPAAEAMLGYTLDEFLAMDFWTVIHPEHQGMVRERGRGRVHGAAPPPRYEFKVITKGGEERWGIMSAGPIEYEGRPAVIGTLFDITDLKQAEEERAKLYEENIRHCTTILEEEKKHIREKEEILRDLHDGLGSMITNISLLSEIAQTATDRSAVRNTLQTIASLSREALSEVRSFVQSLDSKETSWQALLAEFRHHGTVMVEPHSMSFAMESSVDAPHEQVNPRLYMNLFRIFKEAITNTIKHSRAQAVHAALHVDGAGVQLVIRDDGVGMGEAQGGGRGVLNMKKRVEEVGGSWSLTADNGTRISLAVPLPRKYPPGDTGTDANRMLP